MVVALEGHLRACQRCTQDLAALRRTWVALDTLPMVEPPPDFARRVAARVAAAQWERRQNRQAPRTLWRGWLRSLTPVHGIGLAAAAALLAVGLAYPLWMPEPGVRMEIINFERTRPTVTAPLYPPAEADPTLTPQVAVLPGRWESGRRIGMLAVTTERDLPHSVVTAAPMTLVNGRLAWAEQIGLARGTMRANRPYTLPIPLETDPLGAHTVMVRIASPGLAEEYRKVVSFPVPDRGAPGLVTLELQEADIYVALARLAAAAGWTVIADAGLTGKISVRLVNASPEQALNALLGQVGYRWQAAPNSFVVTRY